MNFKEFIKTKPNPNKHTFGEFIWQRREEIGYSAREFSAMLEISVVYLRDIEQGFRPVPFKLLNQIKNLLHIEIDAEDEEDFLDLIYLTKNECAPVLFQYLIENKKARQALSIAIENKITGEELLEMVTNSTKKVSEKENYELLVDTYLRDWQKKHKVIN